MWTLQDPSILRKIHVPREITPALGRADAERAGARRFRERFYRGKCAGFFYYFFMGGGKGGAGKRMNSDIYGWWATYRRQTVARISARMGVHEHRHAHEVPL